MLIKRLFYFKLKTCNLSFTDVPETINHIRRMSEFGCAKRGRLIILWMEVHQISRIIDGHIIANIVVEHAYLRIGIFIFSFQRQIKVH